MMKDLEATMGGRLLEKTPTGVNPTSLGKSLIEYLNQMDDVFNEILYNFCKFKNDVGDVCIWVEDGFSNCYSARCLENFLKVYPNIRIEMITNGDRVKTLNGIDLAFVYDKNPMRLLGREIVQYHFKVHFWCSKLYIEKYGRPKNIRDLLKNHKICLRRESLLWDDIRNLFNDAKHLFVMVENASLILSLVKSGVGVALMPDWMGTLEPDLVSLQDIGFESPHTIYGIVNKNLPENAGSQMILKAISKTFDMDDEKSC